MAIKVPRGTSTALALHVQHSTSNAQQSENVLANSTKCALKGTKPVSQALYGKTSRCRHGI
jgi:hypothetical protein